MYVLRHALDSIGRALRGFAGAAGLFFATSVTAQSHAAIDFDMPAQPLETSLRQIAEAQKLQLVYTRPDLSGVTAPAVKGRYTAAEAVSKVTEGTGLVATFTRSDTVVIKQRVEGSKSPNEKGGQAENPTVLAQAQSAERRDQAASPDRSPVRGEAIVVTAQKREELLKDVPQSVTVLTAKDLAKLGATQFRDFADTVPGLSFMTEGAGLTQITLRGVTTGKDVASTVGIYLDEVPYGSSSAFARSSHATLDAGLFDLERIEVLRGPQGTLYGASTMGGLIKYVTKRPEFDASGGRAEAGLATTQHGGLSYNAAGTLNAPLADKVAVRGTAYYSHDTGYIDNIKIGQKDVNDADIYGGRLDLLFAPTSALTIRLTGFAQDIKRDGFPLADFTAAGPVTSDLEQRRAFQENFDQTGRLFSGTVYYDVGPATLTSITGYQKIHTQSLADLSLRLGSVLNLVKPQGAASVAFNSDTPTKKFTQEIRLASGETHSLDWVIGGFYTREDSSDQQIFSARDAQNQTLPVNVGVLYVPSRFEEYAAFGDLTWYLSEAFSVTGGARYASNKQRFEQVGSGLLFRSAPANTSSESVPTYLANARYQFSELSSGYLRYATGYRPGGPNFAVNDVTTGLPIGPPTFKSDTLKSYEAGFRSEAADRTLSVDVAGYYVKWSDLQIPVSVAGLSTYGNAAGGATIKGVELSVSARPTRALLLTGAFAYQDARLDEAEPALGATQRERLPNVPRFTASANADYQLAGDWRPTIGTTIRYVDSRKTAFGVIGYKLPQYTTVDFRAACTVDRFGMQLYIRNAFDKRGEVTPRLLGFSSATVPFPISILQPRTIGMTVSSSF